MSQENVELARQYFEAFNAQGLQGTGHLRHPEIEMIDPPNFPDADRYVGSLLYVYESRATWRLGGTVSFGSRNISTRERKS